MNGPENNQPAPSKLTQIPMMKEGSEPGRYVYEFNGKKIYEWDQSLDEVNIYIQTPDSSLKAKDFDIQISCQRLKVGLKNHSQYFIDEATFSKVDTSESSWYLDSETSTIHIILMKVLRGETWEFALKGRMSSNGAGDTSVVDPVTKEKIKKDLMLERFQEENPGFDFRGAEFNGSVPDPREFMGGMSGVN